MLTVRTRLFYARRELEEMLSEEPSLASLQASFTKKDDPSHDAWPKSGVSAKSKREEP